ncbi:FCD domain-containing protein [Rathayibacter sp. VKM Ac-2759]|uniref:GntR family transcriptional regulator n=1 Tax=Rathayibacter sp. VKM Ac-2759 TaxID=2609252 RepID=UPI001315ED4B|nr:GntR family transcriptional regulator [Rathayibacter sp. VKM Ac-2759]QHC68056.1 FCD domain-containing protein [Rathayibacter sp. VKM Ac-2759]
MTEAPRTLLDTAPASPSTPTPSLAEQAFTVLRDRLVVLDIRPGEPLNDEQIGKELGVGRTPVREALKRLESEHLVVMYPRRGTFAASVDITDLAQISEVRSQLEPLAAGRAARFATASRRAAMRELADELERIDSGSISSRALMQYDLQVHRSIYAANGNRHLEEILVRYDNLATRIWCMVLDRLPSIAGHIGEHIALLRDVAEGNDEKASREALAHVLSFEKLVRTVL